MSQESQRDRQEGVSMKHMNEDDPLSAKKEAKIIRMVVGDDVLPGAADKPRWPRALGGLM